MSNNKDFKVKNGIKPTAYYEAVGNVVFAVEGFSIAGASYDSKSFSVASQESAPNGVQFKTDGTKMYVVGENNDTVYSYTLSTAWDVSTASFDSAGFSVTAQDSFPMGLFFKPDGTKMYIGGLATNSVFQYSLSTPWDILTASYDSVSFNVGSDGVRDLFFKADGTKMYIIHSAGTDSVKQYTLSTPWNVSTASYDSKNLVVAGQETVASEGVFFSDDGFKVFIVGQGNDTVYQYNLTTAWDVSTGSYSGVSFSVQSQEGATKALSFGDSGKKMYVAGSINGTVYQYSTALNTASLDLSTGSVFDYAPTSDVQVTLSNPATSGTSSGATLLLTGTETTGVVSTFSTTLYTGNGGTQTVSNGINLANDGGLVWLKNRGTATDHALFDTERGVTKALVSNGTNAESVINAVTAFNVNGFSLGSSYNSSSNNYVSWTFKQQTKFFDIVTYTGNGVAGRQIAHNLGAAPAFIAVKQRSGANPWMCYHRSTGATSFLELNSTAAAQVNNTAWNDTEPTDTVFTLGSGSYGNTSGQTYVAYLFAHDPAADGLIQGGSYVGNGSTNGPEISLGWEPQWVMIKRASGGTGGWFIFDSERGIVTGGADATLQAESANAENTVDNRIHLTASGFKVETTSSFFNTTSDSYVYIAIRAPYIPTVTYDPNLQWSAGTAPTAPANGETDVITFNTTDGGTTYTAVQAIDGAS